MGGRGRLEKGKDGAAGRQVKRNSREGDFRSGYSFSLSLLLFSSRKSRKSCALSKSFIHCS